MRADTDDARPSAGTAPGPAAPGPGAGGYTVRVVAERLGIPTATLRSWNRRYGIGPGQERPGKHRLYTESDIATLEHMLDLIRSGASPAGAAATVTGRGARPELGHWEPLLTAAFALDSRAVSAQLTAHLEAYGVMDTWNLLCRPAFAAIVDRQLSGEGCIDVEHLLSWSIAAALHAGIAPAVSGRTPVAVLACTSGETHALALEALRAALVERGANAWMLGADVPTPAIADAIARIEGHPYVVLWSHQETTALTSAIRVCLEAGARVLVGGPGWDEVILPEGTLRVHSLEGAVEAIIGPVAGDGDSEPAEDI
ncbi:MAG TPA: MerR family transcriptional regulator [Nocardia sp.]|uniref:MerR family transcriptional regulator n=1 Tax=Nocardia sp. TaxID=1821 RepID=UPI002B4B663B|nr:MerR family transcriptional regulator [Nocardia sp.]HLS77864.1 MerR family transcriptional regulator [Nocardia sp.]